MSFQSGGILSWRWALLCALVAGGYQFHRYVDVSGLESLSFHLKDGDGEAEGGRILSGLFPGDSGPKRSSADIAQSPVDTMFPDFVKAVDYPPSDRRVPQGTPASLASSSRRADEKPTPHNLRIATWAMGGFGPRHLRDPEVMAVFAPIIHRFDIVALQQVKPTERDFLPQLVHQLNRDGRAYDFLAGPVQGGSPSSPGDGEQLVFLFDSDRVVTDRTQLYTVADPDNRLTHKPLVAWFRAAQIDPRRAWTFSLVNMRVDVTRARQEIYELPRLIAAIGSDGRGEDDVIVAGLFQADHTYLSATVGQSKYWIANDDKPTDVIAKYQTSNVITDRRATTEAILRGGVIDFLRAFNLSIAQAERISPSLPVYAEFCPWEGGY
jgi:hypothetical protein